MNTDPRNDRTAHTALTATQTAQETLRLFVVSDHALAPIAPQTAAQRLMVRELIGSLTDVGLEPLEH